MRSIKEYEARITKLIRSRFDFIEKKLMLSFENIKQDIVIIDRKLNRAVSSVDRKVNKISKDIRSIVRQEILKQDTKKHEIDMLKKENAEFRSMLMKVEKRLSAVEEKTRNGLVKESMFNAEKEKQNRRYYELKAAIKKREKLRNEIKAIRKTKEIVDKIKDNYVSDIELNKKIVVLERKISLIEKKINELIDNAATIEDVKKELTAKDNKSKESKESKDIEKLKRIVKENEKALAKIEEEKYNFAAKEEIEKIKKEILEAKERILNVEDIDSVLNKIEELDKKASEYARKEEIKTIEKEIKLIIESLEKISEMAKGNKDAKKEEKESEKSKEDKARIEKTEKKKEQKEKSKNTKKKSSKRRKEKGLISKSFDSVVDFFFEEEKPKK